MIELSIGGWETFIQLEILFEMEPEIIIHEWHKPTMKNETQYSFSYKYVRELDMAFLQFSEEIRKCLIVISSNHTLFKLQNNDDG